MQYSFVQDHVYSYCSYDDLRTMECVCSYMNRPAHDIRQRAAEIITRALRLISAHIKMMKEFIYRCACDPHWKRKYIFIHRNPQPHICFRVWPKWLLHSPIKHALMEIALAHVDVSLHLHGWDMDHPVFEVGL